VCGKRQNPLLIGAFRSLQVVVKIVTAAGQAR
jgi:hypothetical protein